MVLHVKAYVRVHATVCAPGLLFVRCVFPLFGTAVGMLQVFIRRTSSKVQRPFSVRIVCCTVVEPSQHRLNRHFINITPTLTTSNSGAGDLEFSGLGGGAFGGSGGAGWLPEEGFAAPVRLSEVGRSESTW